MSQPSTRSVLTASFLCAAALLFAFPALSPLENWGVLDWDFQLYHHGVPRATLVDYGELPLWNPFNRSGVPMLAHPESRLLSPTFVATLLFGEVIGLKLEILLHAVVALLGVYALLRRRALDEVAACAGAIAFGFSSFFALHITVGHVWALSFAWLPWLVIAYDRAAREPRFSLAVSGLLVVIFFSGAPYPFMIGSLFVGVYGALCAVRERRLRVHALLLLGIALQVGALGAVKLIPTVELMSAFPRTTAPESGYTLPAFANALFDPDQSLAAARADRPEEFNSTPLHEGMYVGVVAGLLFVAGVATRARAQAPLLAAGALFFGISLGQHAPIDLWSWLHLLPGFDNMRLVQRFSAVGLMVFACFVGFGVAAVSKRSRAAAILATALLLVELFAVSRPVLRDAFPIAPLATEARSEFEQSRGLPHYDAQGFMVNRRAAGLPAMSSLYPSFLSLRGSTRGYQIVPFASHGVPAESPDYRGEVFVEGGGSARFTDWSPNRMEITLESPAVAGDLLVVNQNHDRGWSAQTAAADDATRGVRPLRGLIAIAIEPGDRRLTLRYRPRSVAVGAAISALAGCLAVAWLLGPQLRRGRRSARRRPTAW